MFGLLQTIARGIQSDFILPSEDCRQDGIFADLELGLSNIGRCGAHQVAGFFNCCVCIGLGFMDLLVRLC